MLYQRIKEEQLAARKARNTIKKNLLTTLLGEAGTSGKQAAPEDKDVLAVIIKFENNLNDTIEARLERGQSVEIQQQEIAELQEFKPKMLSDAELEGIVAGYIAELGASGMRDMGKVMSCVKQNYLGRFDGGALSKLVKAALI